MVMTSLPPHALCGITALGIVLGPFSHGFHSSPLLTSLEPSSTMTITTAVPFSSEGTGLTLLPLPTLVHLLSLLFQVNQPPFLPSTHTLQSVSSSSYHPLPSLHKVLLCPHSLVPFSTTPEKGFHQEPNSSPPLT